MLVNIRCFPDEVIFNRHLADVWYMCYLGRLRFSLITCFSENSTCSGTELHEKLHSVLDTHFEASVRVKCNITTLCTSPVSWILSCQLQLRCVHPFPSFIPLLAIFKKRLLLSVSISSLIALFHSDSCLLWLTLCRINSCKTVLQLCSLSLHNITVILWPQKFAEAPLWAPAPWLRTSCLMLVSVLRHNLDSRDSGSSAAQWRCWGVQESADSCPYTISGKILCSTYTIR